MRNWVTVVALLVAGLLVGQAFRAPAQGQPAAKVATKWEYKVVGANELELNALGENVWEFAGIASEVTDGKAPAAVNLPLSAK